MKWIVLIVLGGFGIALAVAICLRNSRIEFVGMSPNDQKRFAYAMKCPLSQTLHLTAEDSSEGTNVEIHKCDAKANSDPDWFSHTGSFAIALQHGLFHTSIIGGDSSDSGFNSVTPVHLGKTDAFLLVDFPQGSGGFVSWCLLALRHGRVVCIEPSEKLSSMADKYVHSDEQVPSDWTTQYDGVDSLTLSKPVYAKPSANSTLLHYDRLPLRASITTRVQVVNDQLEAISFARTNAASAEHNASTEDNSSEAPEDMGAGAASLPQSAE